MIYSNTSDCYSATMIHQLFLVLTSLKLAKIENRDFHLELHIPGRYFVKPSAVHVSSY